MATTASISVISVNTRQPHDEILESGVRSIGLSQPFGSVASTQALIEALDRVAPKQVVMRLPSCAVLRHCLSAGIDVFPNLADSFVPRPGLRGLKDRYRAFRLARLLADPRIRWVSNHNVPASRQLADLGVQVAKIVPWDWPRDFRLTDTAPRTHPLSEDVRLLCLGTVSEAKGVGDVIRAISVSATLRARVRLTVVGSGDIAAMRSLAAELGVSDRVEFTGPVKFSSVPHTMLSHDILLVYSRSSYSEGMPGTLYEGFAAHIPIIMSRHPMFAGTFVDGIDTLMADAESPRALAVTIQRLLDDPELYVSLSANADSAFAKIEYPVLWADVVENWRRNDAAGDVWLAARSLDQVQIKGIR
jgi:glycosyltransferase involved in cell wall biosynthesis